MGRFLGCFGGLGAWRLGVSGGFALREGSAGPRGHTLSSELQNTAQAMTHSTTSSPASCLKLHSGPQPRAGRLNGARACGVLLQACVTFGNQAIRRKTAGCPSSRPRREARHLSCLGVSQSRNQWHQSTAGRNWQVI